jgi:AbiU2
MNLPNALEAEASSIYRALYSEVSRLHGQWGMAKQLFGESQGNIEILNRTAPSFFAAMRILMVRDTILAIAKLIDSPKSCGEDNLTIRQLPDLIRSIDGRSVDIKVIKEQVLAVGSFTKNWRNKELAHKDLQRALNIVSTSELKATEQEIDGAIAALANIINTISESLLGYTTRFDRANIESINSLVHYLTLGHEAEHGK